MGKLNRVIQCKNCPWRVDADITKIKNYDPKQHEGLECTIAKSELDYEPRALMACHHSKEGSPEPCIGYLNNQLFEGNNIPLRLRAKRWENVEDIKIIGEQLKTFEETKRKILD